MEQRPHGPPVHVQMGRFGGWFWLALMSWLMRVLRVLRLDSSIRHYPSPLCLLYFIAILYLSSEGDISQRYFPLFSVPVT